MNTQKKSELPKPNAKLPIKLKKETLRAVSSAEVQLLDSVVGGTDCWFTIVLDQR